MGCACCACCCAGARDGVVDAVDGGDGVDENVVAHRGGGLGSLLWAWGKRIVCAIGYPCFPHVFLAALVAMEVAVSPLRLAEQGRARRGGIDGRKRLYTNQGTEKGTVLS